MSLKCPKLKKKSLRKMKFKIKNKLKTRRIHTVLLLFKL